MGGRIINKDDLSPEQWAGLRERIEFAERAIAARPALDHAAAYLAARGPEVSRRLAPVPRLEETILSASPRSVVTEAASILDQLNSGLNPSDREAADAALTLAILARCQALMDAAKERLQS